MSRIPPTLKPVNRHVLLVPHIKKKENQSKSGVLLPEDYQPDNRKYVTATVIDIAEDCNSTLTSLRRGNHADSRDVIVDRSMIEEVEHNSKNYYLILENYIVGLLRG